MSNMLS